MAIPISRLDNSLDKLVKKIEKSGKDYVLFAVNEAYALFMDRVFNKNKTMSGQSFGRYKTKAWMKKRKNAGRQTSRKDLQMKNDFRDSIKRNVKKDHATIEFLDSPNDILLKIADGQENQIGKGKIFKFSKAENKEVIGKVVKEIKKDITKIVKESFV